MAKLINLTEKDSRREVWVRTDSIRVISESFPEKVCCLVGVEGRDIGVEVLGTAAEVAARVEEALKLD